MKKKKAAHGEDGIIKFNSLLNYNDIPRILDIGAGKEETHANYLRKRGCIVDTVDFFENSTYQGNYNTTFFEYEYDGIHAAHVLEHQLNPHNFLKKVFKDLKEGGWLCITVPPLKHNIVGGHVSLWNAGLILYHLVLAGFDCRGAKIKEYGYNISVIVQKRKVVEPPTQLTFDGADMNLIKKWIPPFQFRGATPRTPGSFNGDIKRHNW